MAGIMLRLPFNASTTPLQAATYLLGISLFSISFLVFLNSSISFVITDLIGERRGVGDIVGTLGFVDELVALVACPLWGLVSDRLGVRNVAVIGYTIIGLALVLFVQARNVYPQLLLARVFFAVGATASATMVTAILPSLTDDNSPAGTAAQNGVKIVHNSRASVALSLESDVTITPQRFTQSQGSSASPSEHAVDESVRSDDVQEPAREEGKPSALAGYVGLFTGCGALVALIVFLPLPARFGNIEHVTLGQAVSYSYYVVGSVAFMVAVFVAIGLRHLKGEEGKGWRVVLGLKHTDSLRSEDSAEPYSASGQHASRVSVAPLPYRRLLQDSIALGFTDPHIGIGYLGGFVARASTVAISLFVPLFVNAFFIRNGFCHGSPNDPSPELKKECRQAYLLASILTGVAQLMGLICAPLFGYLSSRRRRFLGGVNGPLVVAAALGVIGYTAFPQLLSPEPKNEGGRGGSPWVLLIVALMGISQIGAIVCSLGSLGRGVLTLDKRIAQPSRHIQSEDANRDLNGDGNGDLNNEDGNGADATEASTLLLQSDGEVAAAQTAVSRVQLKGSIAGVYSWCGGAAILLLTKLGGRLFDQWSTGAPFYMMAVFNALLMLAVISIDVAGSVRKTRS